MVHSPDESLNIRADIQATRTAMDSYIRSGAYRRAAKSAQHLAFALDKLAALEMPNDRVRHRVIEQPSSPESGDEFLGPTLHSMRPYSPDSPAVRRLCASLSPPRSKH